MQASLSSAYCVGSRCRPTLALARFFARLEDRVNHNLIAFVGLALAELYAYAILLGARNVFPHVVRLYRDFPVPAVEARSA